MFRWRAPSESSMIDKRRLLQPDEAEDQGSFAVSKLPSFTAHFDQRHLELHETGGGNKNGRRGNAARRRKLHDKIDCATLLAAWSVARTPETGAVLETRA